MTFGCPNSFPITIFAMLAMLFAAECGGAILLGGKLCPMFAAAAAEWR